MKIFTTQLRVTNGCGTVLVTQLYKLPAPDSLVVHCTYHVPELDLTDGATQLHISYALPKLNSME
jgi:hypothetical protein